MTIGGVGVPTYCNHVVIFCQNRYHLTFFHCLILGLSDAWSKTGEFDSEEDVENDDSENENDENTKDLVSIALPFEGYRLFCTD